MLTCSLEIFSIKITMLNYFYPLFFVFVSLIQGLVQICGNLGRAQDRDTSSERIVSLGKNCKNFRHLLQKSLQQERNAETPLSSILSFPNP
jgi:hypothetical protein